MRRLLPLVALTLVLASGAEAATPNEQAWIQKASRVASSYWQERRPDVRCPISQVSIVIVPALPRQLWGHTVVGACKQTLLDGVPATIELDRAPFDAGWVWMCTLVVHEWGHLIGLQHSANPNSVMHHRINRRNLLADECGRSPQ